MELFFGHWSLFMVVPLIVIVNLQLQFTSAMIGANLGLVGDNLPTPDDVVSLYKKKNIGLLRMFEPNTGVLNALKASVIKVSLGVKSEDVENIARDFNTAEQWIQTNVVPYINEVDIAWITVGNEMVPGPATDVILEALNNVQSGLNSANVTTIKVSTVVKTNILGDPSPPSAATFSRKHRASMQAIITWLTATGNPLFINVYPYLVYASNPFSIPSDYALFNARHPRIDGYLKYTSLFEAMVDAFYVALDQIGGSNVTLVVSGAGWPTLGNDPYTNKENARNYNQRLINKMTKTGTPRNPSNILDIFISSMFNEDMKAVGIEQNWGIHYPNMAPVYPLTFN